MTDDRFELLLDFVFRLVELRQRECSNLCLENAAKNMLFVLYPIFERSCVGSSKENELFVSIRDRLKSGELKYDDGSLIYGGEVICLDEPDKYCWKSDVHE